MREYRCGGKYGIVVKAPETCCLFCKHCTDVYWDFSNGPYMLFCNIHENVEEAGGHTGDCKDFEEDPDV